MNLQQFDEQLVVVIQDNGQGMTIQDEKKLSESFGLELVNTLTIDQLNGDLECQSNSNGTKYTITIPYRLALASF